MGGGVKKATWGRANVPYDCPVRWMTVKATELAKVVPTQHSTTTLCSRLGSIICILGLGFVEFGCTAPDTVSRLAGLGCAAS
jgi:hypothetical protein